ncbi:MAG TPA: pitrilysin family protein [Gemmatimonadaceae bacterium]
MAAPPGRTLLACAVLALAAPPAAAQGRSALHRALVHDSLPNGLQVIVLENHTVPLATLEVVVRNGAFTQSPSEEGYAHLFEHLLFRAYGWGNASFGIAATHLDAAYNGETREENVSYYLLLPSSNLESGLHLLARLVEHPRFGSGDLDRERAVVIDEMSRDGSDPVRALREEVDERLWGSAWSYKDLIGTADVIRAATPKRLERVFERFYVPNNAALVIGGDVDPARAIEVARRAFGGWDRAPDPFAGWHEPTIPPLRQSQAVVVTSPDAANATIVMEWQGPSVLRDREATYAADVLSDVLASPMSNFQQHLVGSGTFQSVSIGYQTLARTGPIVLTAVTRRDRLRPALIALGTELMQLADSGYITPEELAAAKKAREVRSAFELESGTSMAHTLAYWWSVAGLDYYESYVASMARCTPRQIRDYARTYIVNRAASIGVLTTPDLATDAQRAVIDIFGGGHVTAGDGR